MIPRIQMMFPLDLMSFLFQNFLILRFRFSSVVEPNPDRPFRQSRLLREGIHFLNRGIWRDFGEKRL